MRLQNASATARTRSSTITRYAVGHGSLKDAPALNHRQLKAKGFTDGAIEVLEPAARLRLRRPKFAFNKWTLGEDFCKAALGFTAEQMADPALRRRLADALGFTKAEIEARQHPVAAAP